MVDLIQSEPAHVARTAAHIITEGKHRLASQILGLDQFLEDITLVGGEFTRREKLLCWEFDSSGGVAREQSLVDEPLRKATQDGFHTLPVADTQTCELTKQIGLHSSSRKICRWIKRRLMSWEVREPDQKLAENKSVGRLRRFSFKSEPTGNIAVDRSEEHT